jgi:hypothetical protein
MIWPPKVSRSTIAAQSRGSGNVFDQPENASFEAIATEFFSSRSVQNLEQRFGVAFVELHVPSGPSSSPTGCPRTHRATERAAPVFLVTARTPATPIR